MNSHYSNLYDLIQSIVKPNNNQEITGQLLQNVLNQMIDASEELYQLAQSIQEGGIAVLQDLGESETMSISQKVITHFIRELQREIENAGEVNDVLVDGQSVVDENKIAYIDSSGFGHVDDVQVNGQSVVSNKIASFNVPNSASAHVQENDTPGTPEASASIENGNIDIEFRHVKGERGNGIKSSSEQLSPNDSGTNIYTFIDDDGNLHTFHARNGATGRPGADRQPIDDITGLSIAHNLGDDPIKLMSQEAISYPIRQNKYEIGGHSQELQLTEIGYISVNGVLNSTSGYHRTGKIPVEPGMFIQYKGTIKNDTLPCVAAYDANENFVSALIIGRSEPYTDYILINIPYGIFYIAVASTDGYTASAIMNFGLKEKFSKIEADNNNVKEVLGIANLKIGYDDHELLLEETGYIASSGNFMALDGYIRTDYVEVVPGMVVKYKGKIGNVTYPCVAAYDANKNYIKPLLLGRTNAYTDYKIITIPEGVAYIAAASTDTEGVETTVLIKGGLEGRMTDVENKSKEIDDVKNTIGKESVSCSFSETGYIENDGEPNTTTGYKRTILIAVSQGDVVLYKGKIGNSRFPCVAAYNTNRNYIESLLDGRSSAYSSYEQISIPEGVAYVAAASTNGIDTELIILGGGLLNRVAELEKSAGGHYLANEYYGKIIDWLGDSIVQDDDFDDRVIEYFSLVKGDGYESHGINGSTIAKDTNDTRDSMAVRYSDMDDDADVIVVSGGTNDYQYSWTPFGELGDNTVETFYGALDVLCRGLITKYPTKLIFFTTPIKRNQHGSNSRRELDTTQDVANSLGKTLKDYCDAIKDVCAKYSIPVCDLYSESLLNPNMTAQASMFDSVGTHPNSTGKVIMARRVRGFMKQLM